MLTKIKQYIETKLSQLGVFLDTASDVKLLGVLGVILAVGIILALVFSQFH